MSESPASEILWPVHSLLAEYCTTLDSGQFQAWSELFVPDGRLELPTAVIMGREKLTRFGARSTPGVHVSGLPLISLADGVVRSVSSWIFVERATGLQLAGYYRDDIVLAAGRYRFKSRQIEMSTPPAKG